MDGVCADGVGGFVYCVCDDRAAGGAGGESEPGGEFEVGVILYFSHDKNASADYDEVAVPGMGFSGGEGLGYGRVGVTF